MPSEQARISVSHAWGLLSAGFCVGDAVLGLGVGSREGAFDGLEVGLPVAGAYVGLSVIGASVSFKVGLAVTKTFDEGEPTVEDGEVVVGGLTPLSISNASDSNEIPTSPNTSGSNDFKYEYRSEAFLSTSITYSKCKPENAAGPLTVIIRGTSTEAKRRRRCLVFCNFCDEEDTERRRLLFPLLSPFKTTSTNSTDWSKSF